MTRLRPQVSVILPTFNRSRKLGDAMESVLRQSFEDLELIVVDDGSIENVKAIVERLDDGRVRYFRRPINEGAAAARNTGVALAQGDLIAFQDSDDLWLPGKLARQVDRLRSLPPEVGAVTAPKILLGRNDRFAYGPGLVCLAPPEGAPLRLDEDQVGHLLRENRISVQCSLFRRDVLGAGPCFDTLARANEDWEFAIRLAQRTKILEEREPVVIGFVSADSISRSSRREALGIVRILKANRSLLTSYPRERSDLWLAISRQLADSAKPRWANRVMFNTWRTHPQVTISVARAMLRRMLLPLRAHNRSADQRSV